MRGEGRGEGGSLIPQSRPPLVTEIPSGQLFVSLGNVQAPISRTNLFHVSLCGVKVILTDEHPPLPPHTPLPQPMQARH